VLRGRVEAMIRCREGREQTQQELPVKLPRQILQISETQILWEGGGHDCAEREGGGQ
jgi:hypothetical protein